MLHPHSHEQHELYDRGGPQQFTEGVDKQVKGQQCQLDQQHQRVVIGLEHICSDLEYISTRRYHNPPPYESLQQTSDMEIIPHRLYGGNSISLLAAP